MAGVLYFIGGVIVIVGIVVGVGAVGNMDRSGLGLNNLVALSAFGTAAGIVVTGILFMAFGRVIGLLRRIQANGERSVALLENVSASAFTPARRAPPGR